MNLMRTSRTYKTPETAEKALARAFGGKIPEGARYLIAVMPLEHPDAPYRYAPVLVGGEYVPFAHLGITVVG